MKKNTLSKCSLAISIALGLFTSSAFAVNNDINPLTGAPVNPVASSATPPASGNGIQLNTPSGLVDENVQDSTKAEDKSSLKDDKDEDYSYANEEQNLKKASNLKVQLTILDLENQIKTKKDELKGIKPDSNQQSGQNGLNINGGVNAQNSQVQPAPKPVYETVETKTPAVKATAVYGLGKDVYAEIYVGDNKYVMNVGSTLPNGYKLIGVNNFGVTLRKGNSKIQLPIVAVPREGANINVTTQKRLVSQQNNTQNNVMNSPPVGLGVNIPPEMK